MSDPIDHEYYARRAREEIERAEQVENATIAAVHYDMARRYALLAADEAAEKPVLTLVPAGGEAQRAA